MKFSRKCVAIGVSSVKAKRRAYIDSNVWIAAIKSEGATASRALSELEASDIQPVISDYVRLETLPKPKFLKRHAEVQLLEQLFTMAERIPLHQHAIVERALELAAQYDLTPVDALHVGTALEGVVDKFITLEKPSKPFFRITEVRMRSIYEEGAK